MSLQLKAFTLRRPAVAYDALHLAYAESGDADVFLTRDAKLVNTPLEYRKSSM